MADIQQITVKPDGLSSFSIPHEAGVDVTVDTVGVKYNPDRVDGAGIPIVEEVVIPAKCTLPNCVNNRVRQTYERVREVMRASVPSIVTVVFRDGDVFTFFNARFTDATELNKTKGTFGLMIQGDTNSGLQS